MKFKLLLSSYLLVAAASASFAYSHAPVKIQERIVMVETQVPITMSIKQTAASHKAQLQLAAAIPASALGGRQ